MTCRHTDPVNNPLCGSFRTPEQQVAMAEKSIAELREKFKLPATPDAEDFEIVNHKALDKHLVLRVKYPSCAACSFEGEKILVYLNCGIDQALRWRKIDPHFRASDPNRPPREAPSPDARFPATDEGWKNAKLFAACAGKTYR